MIAERPSNRGLETEAADPKYAHVELERRWLVDVTRRPALEGAWVTVIEDRYITGTRLRLRQMIQPDTGETRWKLSKKYETEHPEARPVVTAYLTEAEHAVFAALPANVLHKRRYHLPVDGRVWSLDVMEGSLSGLEIVEIEAANPVELAELVPPVWATKEVTDDARYQCGSIARNHTIPE